MTNKEKAKQEKKEPTLEDNLKNKAWVNYHIIKLLEETKRINYAIFELLNQLVNKEEEREGIFKSK